MVSPNFGNHFILYCFASEDTIVGMLIQKNQKVKDLPVSFMRKELHDYEFWYLSLEKQAFTLVKVVSYFRQYILSNPIKSYAPHPLVKMMLSQPLREGRWDNWLAKVQVYDIEVRPLKLLRVNDFVS